MIVIIDDGQSLTVDYWKQERLIVEKQTQSVDDEVIFWSNLHGSQAYPIATYKPSEVGVSIDLTDYVRTYPNVQYIYIEEVGKSACTLTVSVKGLINPESVLIPTQELADYGALVIPPYMLLISGNENEVAEFFAINAAGWVTIGDAVMNTSHRGIVSITDEFRLRYNSPRRIHLDYMPKLLEDCARYALIKWVSFTGVQRVHWFEVVRQKSETINEYSLLPVDNEYIEIKGRADGLILALNGLNAYDVWYYSDVALSSKVEISLDGGQTFDRVQVTTKEVEIPDFVPNGKVEITVNWKRYDAVNL